MSGTAAVPTWERARVEVKVAGVSVTERAAGAATAEAVSASVAAAEGAVACRAEYAHAGPPLRPPCQSRPWSAVPCCKNRSFAGLVR